MTISSSYEDILLQNLEGKKTGSIPIGGIEFESDEERSRYLISVFPGLVQEGKFFRARELGHENCSFNMICALFDKVQRWLFRKEKDAVVNGKATKTQKESPRSGKENIVWFPPDFGRKHQPGKHKDAAVV